MYQIKTLNNISDKGLKRLPKENYQVSDDFDEPDALLVRSADLHSIEIPTSVLAVARAGAGTNNIPIPELSKRGVPVFNAPGANANAVKELVIAAMIIAARNIVSAVKFTDNLSLEDEDLNHKVEFGKKQFVGFELPSKTLGVIGLGAIGVQVANAAVALGMKVIGYDPNISVKNAWAISSAVKATNSLDNIYRKADFITVHTPLNEHTKGLINSEAIAKMKDSVILLNFARNGIMVESDVLSGIDQGKVGYYLSDFPSPLALAYDNVAALPHLGASTNEAEENCAKMVVDELRIFLEEGNIYNSVNFPEVSLPKNEGNSRLAIVNDNVPNMVTAIAKELGELGLNITELLNRSRGDLAYTLIDVAGTVATEIVTKISQIPGVRSARLIYSS